MPVLLRRLLLWLGLLLLGQAALGGAATADSWSCLSKAEPADLGHGATLTVVGGKVTLGQPGQAPRKLAANPDSPSEYNVLGQAVALRTGVSGVAVIAMPLAKDATPGALAAAADRQAQGEGCHAPLERKADLVGVAQFQAKDCRVWVGLYSARVLDFRCRGQSGGDLSRAEARDACPAPPPKREKRATASAKPDRGKGGGKLADLFGSGGQGSLLGGGGGFGEGGLGLSGTGKGGGGSGEGTIGLGNIGTLGRGGGVGSGSGYGSGAGGLGSRTGGGAVPKTQTVERFPTVEGPESVDAGSEFALQVSLTETKITPDVQVKAGQTTAEGKLKLELDPPGGPWELDVAVTAPGFDLLGSALAKSTLLPEGDSTPVLFKLRAKVGMEGKKPEVFITWWFKGRFLAKVAKVVAVRSAGQEVAVAKEKAPPAQQGSAAAIAPKEETPDLTLWLIEGADPTRPDEAQILIQSPHLQPVAGAHRVSPELAKRLDEQYAQFARKVNRGAEAMAAPEPTADSPERNILMLKGFGSELYANAAPLLFKQALATLQTQLGSKLRSVQIYTNSPRLPWELLAVPKPGGGESEFLGTQYRVARWHITSANSVLTRPTQRLSVRGVYLVAPKYDAARDLPAQEREVQSIVAAGADKVRRVGGTLAEVRSLVAGTVPTEVGVVHFAGHGQASAQASDKSADFAIRLADGDLPLLQWKGLAGRWGGAHPLVFFNACEVGRAEKTAGFVDGWGPAVLETGASGYIGGLWPLGDTAAADAAQVFYRAVLAGGAVPVAEAVRQVRARFAETGDPTYLAYVFYGDAALTVQGPTSEASGGPPKVAFGPPQVQGGLPADLVRRLLLRQINAFRYCAELGLQKNPSLVGRAVLQFVVDPKGAVVASSIQASTLGAPMVEQCWASRVRMLQFPAPEGGGIAMVNVPIALAP